MKTYKILQARGLPIPSDLKAEVEAVLGGGEEQPSPGGLPGMPGGAGPGAPPGAGGPMGGPGEGIVMPPAPPGLMPPGQLMGGGLGPTGVGMGAPGTPGSTPAIAPNGMGIGNGFAPPASFERRPGMPKPASVQEESTEHTSTDDTPPMMKREEITGDDGEEAILYTLPKAAKKKTYSFIDEDAEPLTDETDVSPDQELDESSNQESTGPASNGDSAVDGGGVQ
jgi:hypothetical protein